MTGKREVNFSIQIVMIQLEALDLKLTKAENCIVFNQPIQSKMIIF